MSDTKSLSSPVPKVHTSSSSKGPFHTWFRVRRTFLSSPLGSGECTVHRHLTPINNPGLSPCNTWRGRWAKVLKTGFGHSSIYKSCMGGQAYPLSPLQIKCLLETRIVSVHSCISQLPKLHLTFRWYSRRINSPSKMSMFQSSEPGRLHGKGGLRLLVSRERKMMLFREGLM